MRSVELNGKAQLSLILFVSVYIANIAFNFAPFITADESIAWLVYDWTVCILLLGSILLGLSAIGHSIFPLTWVIPSIVLLGWYLSEIFA